MGRFGFDVVDSDGHVMEMRTDLERFGWEGTATEGIENLLAQGLSVGRGLSTRNPKGARDPSWRLQDMDAEGIDVSVNYPTPLLGVSDFPDPASSASACRAYNDWFAATYREEGGGRLRAVALVPMRDAAAAAAEARRAITELGACGVMVQPYVGDDVHLSDREFDPLWDVLEELGKPVAVHGSRHTCPPKISAETFAGTSRFYAMCHPFQQMVAMGDFALGGVLARHPTLKVAFLESGIGWMPYYIERLDEAYEDLHEESEILECEPSEYLLSGNCFFSCEPDEGHLAYMVDALGSDQIIYASDYPHFDCKFPDSVAILSRQSGLSTDTLSKIAARNARRLYSL